jgi:hypothetical protein
VVVGAAFVPETPLLVPEVAQGAAGELDELREACRTAITKVAAAAEHIVVVGAGPAWRTYAAASRGTLAGFGVAVDIGLGSDGPGPVELPASLTVGAWLVRDALGDGAGAIGVAARHDGAPDLDLPTGNLALVVVGDGSARRTTSAPGYLDERAGPFDAAVADALRRGDPGGLRVDPTVARELLAGGAAAWHAAAALLDGGPYDAELFYDAAPYGVGYFVAAWTVRA